MSNRVLKCDKYRITQKYSSKHKGIDLVKYYSSLCPIIAHTDGVVVMCATGHKNDKNATGTASYGNFVKLKHSNGYYTLYAHMEKVYVKKGDKVKRGQEIGYMGNTGRSFGAHLHFEVREPSEYRINPEPYLDKDLPNMGDFYQVYDNVKNKWLPKVRIGSNDYAGNYGNSISGLKVDKLTYRVHDKVKGYWLPWVTGNKDYAGNLPNDIDGVQIKNATYRVHIKGGKWLSWVNKVDDTKDGYAGIYGESIDAIQIK